MKITYWGHACLKLEIDDYVVLVDPFVSGNPLAKAVEWFNEKVDFILLTHAHEDHVLDAESIAKAQGATIVANYEIAMYYQAKGCTVHPMNIGGSWQFPFGVVQMVTAHHTSSFADGTYGGQPAGFVIQADKNIYIAGDTALTLDMQLIALRTRLDLTVLPIGNNFTMDVVDACQASEYVACNRVLGYHYDTFGYITINQAEAKRVFADKGKELILLPILGEYTV